MTPPAAAPPPRRRRSIRGAPPRPRRAPATRRPRRVSGPARAARRGTAPAGAAGHARGRGRSRAARALAEAVATHRLLDRLIRGRVWIGVDRVRADRDRDAAAGLLKLNAGHRPLARARSAAAARERRAEHRKLRTRRGRTGRSAGRARSAWNRSRPGALRFLTLAPASDVGQAAAALSGRCTTSRAAQRDAGAERPRTAGEAAATRRRPAPAKRRRPAPRHGAATRPAPNAKRATAATPRRGATAERRAGGAAEATAPASAERAGTDRRRATAPPPARAQRRGSGEARQPAGGTAGGGPGASGWPSSSAGSARSSGCSSCCSCSRRGARCTSGRDARRRRCARPRATQQLTAETRARPARHDHRPQRRRPRRLRARAGHLGDAVSGQGPARGRAEARAAARAVSQATVLQRALSEHTGFVYLARALPGQAGADAVLALKIAGIAGTPVMRRVYPRGTLAAQVLGIVGTEGNGLTGLEYSQQLAAARARGRAARGQRRARPADLDRRTSTARRRARSLSLTLDANIQQRTEDVLGAVAQVFDPKDATAIVMDPQHRRDPRARELAAGQRQRPAARRPTARSEDRAVGFNYEPGSTFKVVTVSGALEQGLITPSTAVQRSPTRSRSPTARSTTTPNTPKRRSRPPRSSRSRATSGRSRSARWRAPERFNHWVHRFGFGAPTGVELPGEETGVALPLSEYSGSSMGNLPIGQGELVTPMQMATAYSAIANGGILRRAAHHRRDRRPAPARSRRARRVISRDDRRRDAHDAEGRARARAEPPARSRSPATSWRARPARPARSTRRPANTPNTAYVASFIGFAPASDPKLLCAVVVDEPQTGSIYGGTVAAPAFGQIMSFALPYLGIPPG